MPNFDDFQTSFSVQSTLITVFSVIFGIIFFTVIIVFIVNIVKHRGKISEVGKTINNKINELDTNQILENVFPNYQAKKQEYKCTYCGTILDENEKSCSACGAKRKLNKK